jgi:hypothetical protein
VNPSDAEAQFIKYQQKNPLLASPQAFEKVKRCQQQQQADMLCKSAVLHLMLSHLHCACFA